MQVWVVGGPNLELGGHRLQRDCSWNPHECTCLVVGPSLQLAELPGNKGFQYRGDFVELGMLVFMTDQLVPGAAPSGTANMELIHRTIIIW